MPLSLSQADANARAYALACKRAREHLICFANDSLPVACVGTEYVAVMQIVGGVEPISYAITLGALPAGLQLDGQSGVISGLVSQPFSTSLRITATDGSGASMTKEFAFRGIGMTSPTGLPAGTVNSAYSYQMVAAGTSGGLVWSVTSGALPTGLTMSATGLISGTPTADGTASFTVSLEDAAGAFCEKEFTIDTQVAAIPPATLYWTLDDTRLDSVVGLLLGGSAPNNYVPGRINHGFRLPTTVNASRELEILDTASAAYTAGQGLCFSFWINWAVGFGPADVVQSTFINAGFTLFLNVRWQLVLGNLTASLEAFDGTNFGQISALYPLVIGQWDFITVIYNPATGLATLYLNGAVGLATTTPVALPSSPLNSIRFMESGGGFGIATDFKIDEVAWFIGPTLTAAQVALLYNAGAGRRPPNVP